MPAHVLPKKRIRRGPGSRNPGPAPHAAGRGGDREGKPYIGEDGVWQCRGRLEPEVSGKALRRAANPRLRAERNNISIKCLFLQCGIRRNGGFRPASGPTYGSCGLPPPKHSKHRNHDNNEGER